MVERLAVNEENDKVIRAKIEDALRAMPREEFEKIAGIAGLLAAEMAEQQSEGESSMLFCGSDGRVVVKAYHYPRELIGSDGPICLPSSNDLVVIGAYSDEFIQRQSDEIRNEFPFDEMAREKAWEQFLNICATELAKVANDAPLEADIFDKFLEDL